MNMIEFFDCRSIEKLCSKRGCDMVGILTGRPEGKD